MHVFLLNNILLHPVKYNNNYLNITINILEKTKKLH